MVKCQILHCREKAQVHFKGTRQCMLFIDRSHRRNVNRIRTVRINTNYERILKDSSAL